MSYENRDIRVIPPPPPCPPESDVTEFISGRITPGAFGSWRRFWLCMLGAATGIAAAWYLASMIISLVEKA